MGDTSIPAHVMRLPPGKHVINHLPMLVLGMMGSGANPDPSTKSKLMWGGLVAGIAISLLPAGGLKAVQTATIVFALPFTVVIVLMMVALWRAGGEDWTAHEKRERGLRRRMRQMVEK